jgi:uncharacterized protein (TIGR02466 family)
MIEFEHIEVIPVFPTFIHKGKLINDNEINKLQQSLLDLRYQEDPNIEFWQSTDLLHTDVNFTNLTELILQETTKILDGYSVIRDSHYIAGMWGNIHAPNVAHAAHIHPNSYLSGVLYLNTPTDCGPLVFHDPRPASNIIEFAYESYNIRNGKTVVEIPEKGKMLVWPSWLMHGVELGRSQEKEYRISIAFNVMLKGSVNIPTKRIVF